MAAMISAHRPCNTPSPLASLNSVRRSSVCGEVPACAVPALKGCGCHGAMTAFDMLFIDEQHPSDAAPPLVYRIHGAAAVVPRYPPQSVGDQTGSVKGRWMGGPASAASPGGSGMCDFGVGSYFWFFLGCPRGRAWLLGGCETFFFSQECASTQPCQRFEQKSVSCEHPGLDRDRTPSNWPLSSPRPPCVVFL